MPEKPTITDLVNARQAELERIKAGSSRAFMARIKPIVDKISKDIRGLETPLTQATIKEVNAILSEVRTELGAAIDASNDELTKDMGSLAVETQKVEKKDIVGATTVTSSAIQTAKRDKLLRAVFKSPIQATGELVETFQSDFKRSQIKGMNAVIRQGISAGQTNLQIAQSIKGLKSLRYNDGQMAKIERQGVTMVNTVVQHVAATSRHAMYEDNDDVFSGYTWVSTLDSRVSKICMNLDGEVFKTGKGPLPPAHPNCFVSNTLVTSSHLISNVTRRAFKGEVFTIRSSRGNYLTVTPNHPILTNRGWVRAKDVNLSHKLVIDGRVEASVIATEGENHAIVPTIEQVFESLRGYSEVVTREVPTAAPDFHNDAIDNEVASIATHNKLSRIFHAVSVEYGHQGFFVSRDGHVTRLGTGRHSFADLLVRANPTSGGNIGGLNEPLLVSEACPIHSSLLLGASISEGYSIFSEDASYGRWCDAEFLSNSVNANSAVVNTDSFGELLGSEFDQLEVVHPTDGNVLTKEHAFNDFGCDTVIARETSEGSEVEIFFDDVVSVDVDFYSGHVYNMETSDGVVNCNGVLSHNCRSSTKPNLKPEYAELFGDPEEDTRASATGPTQAKDYFTWLRRQPRSVQDTALGVERAEIFNADGMTNEKYKKINANKRFEPLTVDQMIDRAGDLGYEV